MVNPEHRTPYGLTLRLLHLHQASAHISIEALYATIGELSSRPEYIEPIRKEIAIVVSKYGWSKTALSEMARLESFIMETLRLNPTSDLTSSRKATKDYVLKNGMCIPKGSLVLLPQFAVHMDDEVYPEPTQFQGFRFCANPSLENAGEPTNLTHRFTRIRPDFLLFGIGDHACPGRFFATTSLKIAMAHLIHTYDFKADPASPYKYRHDMIEMITDPNFTLLLKARN
ncbi:hypothetical protein Clacol_007099 [Clathrus columnatus]|uniref:Cytochrome P450 n=1 Tax=Clathrus columnatus TaxID=1419009 RepID=A0AAV5AE01_9AGAM|nr:hypothetical protein Clacol_007099 [Clathrus columnatus]